MLIGLSAYQIRIKERRADEWWRFAHGTRYDAYSEFMTYFAAREGKLVRLGEPLDEQNYTDQRALLLSRYVHSESTRMIAGLFLKGEAGTIRQIRNFDDPEGDPVYETAINEGILTPLYCRLHLEDGRPFGVALMQTMGMEGLKGYLDRDFRRYFTKEVPQERTVKLKQLVDRHVLEAFASQGSLQDIVLVNSGKTARSRDAMQRNTVAGSQLGQQGDKLVLRIARSGGFGVEAIRRLWNALRRQEDPRELLQVRGMDEIDDVKVEIKSGDRVQTFSLLNPDDSPIRMDITNDVDRGPGNLPTWASLHAAAERAWTSISAMIGGAM